MPLLRAYGWLFLISGAAFVGGSGLVAAALDLAGVLLGGGPSEAAAPTYWLVLTGSMMAMIARLAFRLADDPRDETAWEALLLSKAASTALFLAFAGLRRDPLFMIGAVVDGSILAHLAWLRRRAESEDPLAPRFFEARGPFHETWFARLNAAPGGDAAWVRLTLRRGPGGAEAACWVILFPAGSPPRQARWTVPLDEAGVPSAGRFRGTGARGGWDLSWRPTAAPARLTPRWLFWAGLAPSEYVSAVPAGRFSGRVSLDGATLSFEDAPGSLGHIWGRRLGRGWWWAQAWSGPGRGYLELLSARGPLGLRLTVAAAELGGRTLRSTGLLRAMANRATRRGEGWSFDIGWNDGTATRGACGPDLERLARLEYAGPRGERLICRNSKTGWLRAEGLTAEGDAAVETVAPPARGVSRFARAYARHAGLPEEGLDAAVDRCLARLPWWGRWAAELGAAYVWRAAPLLLLGRAAAFDALDDSERERLLGRLQGARTAAGRALFLPLKSVVVGAAYGSRP